MNFRPKLLFFSHIGSPEAITGAEKLLLATVIELSAMASCVLVVPEHGMLSERAAAAGIEVRAAGNVPIFYSMYQGLPTIRREVEAGMRGYGMLTLYRLLAELRPDAVWVNTCVHPLPAVAASRLGIPVVWCLTETMRTAEGTKHTLSLIEQYADRVIGISSSTLAPVRRIRPLLEAKAEVLYPGIDAAELNPAAWEVSRSSRRAQLGLSENSCLVGFIASHLYENKGVDQFLDMAQLTAATSPETVFAVVGNPVLPEYYERCRSRTAAAGLESRFRWLPFERNVAAIYPAMDILVVPSLIEEGFGMTALEGMLFGKAVVAYSSGGLEEIMHATGNAEWLLQPHDSAGLAERVSRLSLNPPLRLAIGGRNGEAARSLFGREAYRQRLAASLERLGLAGEPKPRFVYGSGGKARYELRGWKLRKLRSRRERIAAGLGAAKEHPLPQSVLALFERAEPLAAEAGSAAGAPARRRRSGGAGARGRAARRQASPGRRAPAARRAGRRAGGGRPGGGAGGAAKRRRSASRARPAAKPPGRSKGRSRR
ncbi:glycosyltransferase family 4 protein [Paenibacillus pasadenensis]|uniref:glycosyltransferase family 4 protein n=1 Tax=Paenibacillus pasadenensis TaxID=217090 RepID=UPI00203C687D|nr:glycosyltransferase family 4 protein [Paenibacillus pasadenensis]MCM3746888.1 glycosyltransferase family 4 protein [Paenibacillus pasadenensis]